MRSIRMCFIFLCNNTATTDSYTYCHTLSLHDALPICLSHPVNSANIVSPRTSEPRQNCTKLRPSGSDRLASSGSIARHKHILQRTLQVLRSEEHTSELQSLMRISYAVFCLKKKKQITSTTNKAQTKNIHSVNE